MMSDISSLPKINRVLLDVKSVKYYNDVFKANYVSKLKIQKYDDLSKSFFEAYSCLCNANFAIFRHPFIKILELLYNMMIVVVLCTIL